MHDVAVIGGGPAGATVAGLLARLGYRVILFEKERFPRHHIGESTLPATIDVLESLGVMDDIRRAGFPVKRGGVYVWGTSREPWMFRFGELGIGTAFQVERSRFDEILLNHARGLGVEVLQEHRVTGVVSVNGRVSAVRYRDARHVERMVEARWIVDASGQASLLASQRRTRQVNEDLKNIAVYGYWHGERALGIADVCPEATEDDRNSIFIETIPNGWCWWIPLGETHFSVGVIGGREAFEAISASNLQGHYSDCVNQTSFIRGFLLNSKLREPVRAIQDWSWRTSEFCGAGFLLVGDAAAFVDPILSTGIFLALNSATAAATVINTVSRNLLPEGLCLDWYSSVYKAVYDDYETMVRHWYFGERTQDSWFWRARRIVDTGSYAGFRKSFVLLASGESHNIFQAFVSPEQRGITYFSDVGAMGSMGSAAALRRVASHLELELPPLRSFEQGSDLRLVLAPTKKWVLSYAVARPDGSCEPIAPPR
jgi:halogenation protein CepH